MTKLDIKILQMGWVNIYAPFYLMAMEWENGPNNSKKQISFDYCDKYKSDQKIIDELCKNDNDNSENIFYIGLCEPRFLGKGLSVEVPLKYNLFINRLPVWGFADLELLESHGLLDNNQGPMDTIFQGSTNNRFHFIEKQINNSRMNEKNIDIYTYAEESTLGAYVTRVCEGDPKFSINYSKLEEVFSPLGSTLRQNANPWVSFTVEPVAPFRPGLTILDLLSPEEKAKRLGRLGIVYSSNPELEKFTAIIYHQNNLKNEQFREFYTEMLDRLNESTKFFYGENLRSKLEKYSLYYKEKTKGKGSRKDDATEQKLDFFEWEVYRNHRIYHFDIKEEAEKWQKVFKGIAEEMQQKAEQKKQSEIFRNKDYKYEPLTLKDDEKNFIDKIASNQESEISGDDDLKETAVFILGVLSRLHNAQQLASKKSAIAAIISRNMSHNLGSHVINYLKHYVDILGKSLSLGWEAESNEYIFNKKTLEKYVKQGDLDKAFKDDKIVWYGEGGIKEISFLDESLYRFLEYLNRRMEFIATMTTSVPSTPLTMNFDSEIWKPMVHENSFLVDFIAKSDLDEKMELSLKWMLSIPGKNRKNLEIAVPDGVVGCHALYTIIENFIRNSAKHGSQGSEEDKLEVTIDISEYNNDYFEVKIFDNLKNGKDLIKILKNLQEQKDVQEPEKNQKPFIQFEKRNDNDFYVLNPRLIDETGNLIHQMWGIKEMFIGACFLRGLTPQEYNLKHDKLPVLSTGTDKDLNLVYNFYITKPKFLLILSKKDCNDFRNLERNQFKDNGVDFLDYETFEQGKYFIRHRFCLLHFCPSKDLGQCVVNNGKSRCFDDYNNWIARNENLLPYRIFCDCQHSPTDRNWLSWKSEWTNITNFNKLQNKLYPEWIKQFYDLDEVPSLIIIDSKSKTKTYKEYWKNYATFLETKELESYFDPEKSKSAVIFYSHFMKDRQKDRLLEERERINQNCSRVAWEDISGENATNHLVREVSNSSDVRLRKYELVEACLASVVIIDERIYNNCEADLYDFNWDWRDIRVYNFAIKKDEGNEDQKKKCFISKHSGTIGWEYLNTGYSFLKSEQRKDGKTDFLVIHRGIIEKILGTEKEEVVDELFENLMTVARFIIVDSGRGKPDYISKSRYVRFTNLENLYQWFFDCKISLVRGLFSLINREEV